MPAKRPTKPLCGHTPSQHGYWRSQYAVPAPLFRCAQYARPGACAATGKPVARIRRFFYGCEPCPMNHLGIIQSLPNAPQNIVRTGAFSKFQAICGLIERTDYLAAHAACHATMNGIARTTAAHADISRPESLFDALSRILADENPDSGVRALVIPGLTDPRLQIEICGRCRETAKQRAFDIFFDPPPDATVASVIAQQQALPRFASLCWPYVPTVTPGRRDTTILPPSCLIAPLALATATHLRGVHDMPDPDPDGATTLAKHGIRVLMPKTVDRRRVLSLFYVSAADATSYASPFRDAGTPRRANISTAGDAAQAISQDEIRFETELQETLQAKCAECLRAHPVNNRDLWGALSRTVTSVLMHAKSRGRITGYHVRCDEETAGWGTPDVPVVEILIRYPKRVRSVKFNVNPDHRT